MAKKDEQILSWKTLIVAIIGGCGLAVSTSLAQMFFSTPPSRAEFDGLKNNVSNIETKLTELKKGQTAIIQHIINKR